MRDKLRPTFKITAKGEDGNNTMIILSIKLYSEGHYVFNQYG